MGFRESIFAIIPQWLKGPVGERFMYALTTPFDAVADALKIGVKARMPGVGIPEALAYIGNDRQIERGPAEGEDSYAERLAEALDTWRTAGTARAVMRQLRAYATPLTPLTRFVSNAGVWDTLNTDGTIEHVRTDPGNWRWDFNATWWWRAWLIIDSSSGSPFTKTQKWGDGSKWGDGKTWGSSATRSQVDAIRRIVGKWKPAHASVPWIIVSFDAGLFLPTNLLTDPDMPDGYWGAWSKYVGGVQVPSRNPNAIYLDGVDRGF